MRQIGFYSGARSFFKPKRSSSYGEVWKSEYVGVGAHLAHVSTIFTRI